MLIPGKGLIDVCLLDVIASPGGNALKYYSSVRLDVRRKEALRDNSGVTLKVKVRTRRMALERFDVMNVCH